MAHMQGYKTIKLANGGETIVDETDFEWVSAANPKQSITPPTLALGQIL